MPRMISLCSVGMVVVVMSQRRNRQGQGESDKVEGYHDGWMNLNFSRCFLKDRKEELNENDC